VYTGSLVVGVRTGKGTMTFADGAKYTGDWKNDKYDGLGTLTFANGQKYVGSFKAGMFNGKGTYTFPSGERFVGQFVDDKRNGYGTIYFADGRKYEGNFADGKQDGFGTIYDAKGIKIYAGQWEKGLIKADPGTSAQGQPILARCNSYVTDAKKKTALPRKVDDITTLTDMFCANTPGKPTFTYKYDVDSDLRFDQAALDKVLREKNKSTVCGPEIKMFLPVIDLEYAYYYGPQSSNFAPGKLIGRLHYSNADCP
jgi:hypothetical protein